MSKNLPENIDELFRKGLEAHSELPPASFWENIDKALDKKKVITISKKYYKLKWAAAILLLVSIGMAMNTWHVSKRSIELLTDNNSNNQIQDNKAFQKKSNLSPG